MVRHHKIVCANCRRRKSKCDGASPSCSACLANASHCHYDKSPSLAYVRSLQARIRELERKGSADATSPSQESFVSPALGNQGYDSISLDALGDVSYHNPTSAIHEDLPHTPSRSSHAGSLPSPAMDARAADIRQSLVANAAAQKDIELINLDASLALANISKDLASTLLQLHWCWLHPSFLFVYRPAFTRDMPLLASGDRSSTYCTSTLVKVLYAHSCRFIRSPDKWWSSENHSEPLQELSDRLMSEAKVLLAMETLNPPAIPTIQALLQQSARDIASGRSSSAWLYSGMAFRMAIDLGLHVCPDKLQQYSKSLSVEDIEIRKRLFWSLYAWDKHISLYLGRMPNFVMGAENVSLKFLDDFSDHDPWVPFYGPDPKSAELPPYPPTPGRVMSCFTELSATTAVYQLEALEDGSQPAQSHQAAWAELKFLLDILQRTATAMPGLSRSIEIIKTRIKKILDRQVSRQLNALFPERESKESDNVRPANETPQMSHAARNGIVSNTSPERSSSGTAYEWGPHMSAVVDEDIWLPAFLAQDISYGPEVMLDVQDGLSPETRSALMGSNLDPQLRLNLSAPDSTMSYGPFPDALIDQLSDAPAGEGDKSSYSVI
ncbi:hypothetical protein APSETT444_005784 [Aspergillus pseudonomiae]